MLWGCCWGGWGGAAPRSSGTLLLGSTCCPSLREVRQVGQEVSCSNHDVKQELSNREGWKNFLDILQLIYKLIDFELIWLYYSIHSISFITNRDICRTVAEVIQNLSACFKLCDIRPINCKTFINVKKKKLMKLR